MRKLLAYLSLLAFAGAAWADPMTPSGSTTTLPPGAATSANQTNVQSTPGTPQTKAVTIQGNASGVSVPVNDSTLHADLTATIPLNANGVIGPVGPAPMIYIGTFTCSSQATCVTAFPMPSVATQGMPTLYVHTTSALTGSGYAAVVETSGDTDCSSATNWSASSIPTYGTYTYGGLAKLATSVTNLNIVGQARFGVPGHCIRVQGTGTWTSGTMTFEAWLSGERVLSQIAGPVAIYATPGNGTQLGGTATGTTGALTPSLASIPGKTNFVCHVELAAFGSGMTAALLNATFTGLLSGLNSPNIPFVVTATGGTAFRDFWPCLEANGTATAIQLNAPAPGSGTTSYTATITGFQY